MNKKKLLALLMALVMTLTLVPVTALAEGEAVTDPVARVVRGTTVISSHNTLNEAVASANEAATESDWTVVENGTEVGDQLRIDVYKDISLNQNLESKVRLEVPEGYNVTFDLSGYQFVSTYGAYSIANYGNLTITDSSNSEEYGTGTGAIYNTNKQTGRYYSRDAVRNYGTITINGGNFGDADTDRYNANNNQWGFALRNHGNATINGGYFTACDNYQDSDNVFSYAISNQSNATMTINYATVYGKMNGGFSADGGTITINDGDYCVYEGNTTYYVLARSYGSFVINGGSFQKFGSGAYGSKLFGGFEGMPSWDELETLNGFTVTGGSFVINAGTDSANTLDITPTTYVAQIGTTKYPTLAEAFGAAQDGDTIYLLEPVNLEEPLNVALGQGNSVTLDLGSNVLTGRTNLKSGELTIRNGEIWASGDTQALNVYGSSDSSAENYSVLNLESDVTVIADKFAVCMFGATAGTNGYGAVINTEATISTVGTGKEGTIFVSGNLGKNVDGNANNVINVTGGSISSNDDCAIALNGLATVNISGNATITGNTAIAVKRGTLNVEDDAYIGANGDKNDPADANNNGTEMTGAAISVTPTYSQYGGMAVNVSGGNITSNNNAALYIGHSLDSTTNEKVPFDHAVTLNVTGGYFSGTDTDGAVFVDAAINGDVSMPTKFISGGEFSSEPAAGFVADGFTSVKVVETEDFYYWEVSPAVAGNATVTTSQISAVDDTAFSGLGITEEVQTAITESTGVIGVKLTNDGTADKSGLQAVVDKAKKGNINIDETDATAAINSASSIEVEVKVTVTPTKYSPSDDTQKAAYFSLVPTATVTTKNENGATTATISDVPVTNDMIDDQQLITVSIYTGFEPEQIIHRADDGSIIEVFTDEDIVYADNVATVIISHFSTLEATAGGYVAKIGDYQFTTLEDAFNYAQDGDTITLLSNCSGNGIIVPQGKFNTTGLTVDFDGYTYTVNGNTLAGSTGTKNQAFQLLKDNKITFNNGAIIGDNADMKMLIQNYADLTLNSMTLDATQGTNSVGYVLSTNNGNTVINDTTITAKSGGIAFDVDSGWGGYQSNSVEVTGTSVINGNVEVAFEGKTAGTPSVLTLTSGTLNGDIVMGTGAAKTTVTKQDNFTDSTPDGYEWVPNGEGTSKLQAIAKITYKGAGLRRRVYTNTSEIAYHETDMRLGFEVVLPYGATINKSASYFTWKKGEDGAETKTYLKNVEDKADGITHVANLVLTRVPVAAYDIENHCKLTISYTLDNVTTTVTIDVFNGKSVAQVAQGLINDNTVSDEWQEYAQGLLDYMTPSNQSN